MMARTFSSRMVLNFLLVAVALLLDRAGVLWVTAHRVDALTPWMVFLTDAGFFLGMLLFFVALLDRQLWTLLILVTVAFAGAVEGGFLLKMIFASPRPFETLAIVPLDSASGFSFPSVHALFVFSALPFFFQGRLRRHWGWAALFATLVAFSRVYVGVHGPSDVVAGALVGLGWGSFLLWAEQRWRFSEWLVDLLRREFEVRRQLAHLFIGTAILILYTYDLLTVEWMLAILLTGGLLSVASRWVDLPLLAPLLRWIERPHVQRRFPGKGSFFMVLGSLLCMVWFEKNVALASIAIMAYGDSVTNVLGRYWGRTALPYNRRKTLEGALFGVGAATLAAFYYVPLPLALGASLVAMFVETLDLGPWGQILDDNLLVPVVAGGVLTML